VADTVRQRIYRHGGSSYVQVGRHERADATSEWAFTEYLLSTDLKITDVSFAAGVQTLYVARIWTAASGCADVIERWDIAFPKGSPALCVNVAETDSFPAFSVAGRRMDARERRPVQQQWHPPRGHAGA